MKAFNINVKRCTGCYSCQIGCKDEHVGNDWTPYAKSQPNTGHFWLHIEEHERGQIPQVKMAYVAVPCQHCKNAPCIDACPVDGCIYTRDDGMVVISPVKCTGCQLCLTVCPYGAIYFNNTLTIAQKCTGCAHLLDDGWKAPRCADNCPTEAMTFGEEADVVDSNSEILYPEYGLQTKVHYVGLPKRFVPGTVYDPSTEEVVIGATCTLSGAAGNTTTTTDDFGDFWFEDLGKGEFSLTISGKGKTKTITGDTTHEDLGLGDIALS
jgi:Fe-S-cluster-containing dehydrogenase component